MGNLIKWSKRANISIEHKYELMSTNMVTEHTKKPSLKKVKTPKISNPITNMHPGTAILLHMMKKGNLNEDDI
jgi:hypothetical protein